MTQVREDFAALASEEIIQRVAERMRERNIEVVVVDDGDQARKVVLERLPEGAEVHSGKSKTLRWSTMGSGMPLTTITWASQLKTSLSGTTSAARRPMLTPSGAISGQRRRWRAASSSSRLSQ